GGEAQTKRQYFHGLRHQCAPNATSLQLACYHAPIPIQHCCNGYILPDGPSCDLKASQRPGADRDRCQRLLAEGSAASISASLQPAWRSTAAVSAPSGGGGRSGALPTSSTFMAWRRVRLIGVSEAKCVSKKPTSARCGSDSSSCGMRTGECGMSRRSKIASHSA